MLFKSDKLLRFLRAVYSPTALPALESPGIPRCPDPIMADIPQKEAVSSLYEESLSKYHQAQADPVPEATHDDKFEKRVLRKVDMRLLPMLGARKY